MEEVTAYQKAAMDLLAREIGAPMIYDDTIQVHRSNLLHVRIGHCSIDIGRMGRIIYTEESGTRRYGFRAIGSLRRALLKNN